MALIAKYTLFTTCAIGIFSNNVGDGISSSNKGLISSISYDIKVPNHHEASNLDYGRPGFSSNGIVCLRDGTSVLSLGQDGTLNGKHDFTTAARIAIERDLLGGTRWDGRWDKSLMVDTSIVFDADNAAYTIVVPRYSRQLHSAALLRSVDGCRSWRAVLLRGRNATIEKHDAFNEREGPPTILSYENYGSRRGGSLWLELFTLEGGKLRQSTGAPHQIAVNSRLVPNHSGGGNSSFTTDDRIFVVYPVDTPPGRGTLSVAREFNRARHRWSGPAKPIGRSTTKIGPDNHDLPAITVDPSGRPVVVIGAHHATFMMYAARRRNSILGGWTAPEVVGMPQLGRRFAEYSYVSLNMARDGTINIIARAEYRGGHYELVQFRRPSGSGWQRWPGGVPDRTIAVPKRKSYAAWRQRVSMAPSGALYLSFAYAPNSFTEAEAAALGLAPPRLEDCRADRCWYRDSPTMGAVTLVSFDNGATWR